MACPQFSQCGLYLSPHPVSSETNHPHDGQQSCFHLSFMGFFGICFSLASRHSFTVPIAWYCSSSSHIFSYTSLFVMIITRLFSKFLIFLIFFTLDYSKMEPTIQAPCCPVCMMRRYDGSTFGAIVNVIRICYPTYKSIHIVYLKS